MNALKASVLALLFVSAYLLGERMTGHDWPSLKDRAIWTPQGFSRSAPQPIYIGIGDRLYGYGISTQTYVFGNSRTGNYFSSHSTSNSQREEEDE